MKKKRQNDSDVLRDRWFVVQNGILSYYRDKRVGLLCICICVLVCMSFMYILIYPQLYFIHSFAVQGTPKDVIPLLCINVVLNIPECAMFKNNSMLIIYYDEEKKKTRNIFVKAETSYVWMHRTLTTHSLIHT